MKKIKLLSAIFLLIAFCASAQVTVVDSIFSGGLWRSYRLYIPAAYNGTAAYPLILNLHGYTSNASDEQLYTNFEPIADTAHFLMVYPQGTSIGGQPYWNAGQNASGVDDGQFLSELIDSLIAKYTIDASGVYSCGMSNGGYMSHRLACMLNNKIAAIASVTGSMFPSEYAACVPNRAVPVMQVSGTSDNTVPYGGSSSSMPIDTVVKYWVKNNNCNLTAVFNAVPDINTADGCTAEHYVYSGGTSGSSVELYKIIGGGHTWPGSPYVIGVTNEDFSASKMIWLFFRKYKLSQFVGINEKQNTAGTSIFPNPCSSILTLDGQDISSVTIFDMNGKMMISSAKKQIDISALPQGIYSVVFISGKNKSVKKLVKI